MELREFVKMQTEKFRIAMDALAFIAEHGETAWIRKKAIEAITAIDPEGHSPWKKWVGK